eukprot:scaffold216244_cov27-Tisochrysis_lutea.AAC.1
MALHFCSSRNWTSSSRRPGGGCAQTRSPTHDCANASAASAPGSTSFDQKRGRRVVAGDAKKGVDGARPPQPGPQ